MILPMPAGAGAADEDVSLPEQNPLPLHRGGAIRRGLATLFRIRMPGSILGLLSLGQVDDSCASRPRSAQERGLDTLSSSMIAISAHSRNTSHAGSPP
jgi:hypothetical protein